MFSGDPPTNLCTVTFVPSLVDISFFGLGESLHPCVFLLSLPFMIISFVLVTEFIIKRARSRNPRPFYLGLLTHEQKLIHNYFRSVFGFSAFVLPASILKLADNTALIPFL